MFLLKEQVLNLFSDGLCVENAMYSSLLWVHRRKRKNFILQKEIDFFTYCFFKDHMQGMYILHAFQLMLKKVLN